MPTNDEHAKSDEVHVPDGVIADEARHFIERVFALHGFVSCDARDTCGEWYGTRFWPVSWYVGLQ